MCPTIMLSVIITITGQYTPLLGRENFTMIGTNTPFIAKGIDISDTGKSVQPVTVKVENRFLENKYFRNKNLEAIKSVIKFYAGKSCDERKSLVTDKIISWLDTNKKLPLTEAEQIQLDIMIDDELIKTIRDEAKVKQNIQAIQPVRQVQPVQSYKTYPTYPSYQYSPPPVRYVMPQTQIFGNAGGSCATGNCPR